MYSAGKVHLNISAKKMTPLYDGAIRPKIATSRIFAILAHVDITLQPIKHPLQ